MLDRTVKGLSNGLLRRILRKDYKSWNLPRSGLLEHGTEADRAWLRDNEDNPNFLTTYALMMHIDAYRCRRII
jgi:hypothetical protein